MTTTPGQVLRSVGPKLVPFLKSVCVYFIILTEQPCLLTACFKCLPIISLIIFVLLHGINLSKEYAFNRRILIGLVFSCFGDALLVWPNYFIPGMGMFAVAQVMYTSAFGLWPFNAKLGAFIYTICAIIIYTLMPGLYGILKIGVPLYTLLLGTMSWRAIARVQFFEEQWPWTKLSSCIGSICFVISDTLIGFHHFYSPIPYSQITIMLTYYIAQLGIALSAVES
ncbi:PREDICTED: lysoplasmalogenase-like protein TMEM86A [Ceratosolen solmsi marchali]|uniref:lysoplasmalogenase n=1 Tax=Ceratosolen solmsi marchali TaxID=326594 RepID=A0AAJ7DXG1_9HYME|nr:PREDICTED: lysoplasmalogenase-like protein TMEM86A [Ceratosolen solmsi marchali]